MLNIRKMENTDLDEVAAIEKKLFSQPWSAAGFASSLGMTDTLYYVAQKDGRIVGYCGYLRSFEEADITNVAVSPDAQNQGVAFAMLSVLMDEGRRNGVERYTLEVRESNAPAIALYLKLGFASVGKRKRFYSQPVEDALIMWTQS